MPKRSAAHLKKVNEAVRILGTTTGLNVPQAMILAGFPKKDTNNEIVHHMIHCRLKDLEAKRRTPRRDAPTDDVRITANGLAVSALTGGDDDTGPTHPKPKRKQIWSTTSTIQQRRIDNLAAKRHKSDAHKAAVHLFNAEKQKPDGMSIRQVHDTIMAKYETCPSIATMSHYASNEGLVNAFPMKMGPIGHISAMAFKFLCQAYKSIVSINQMNACTGDNSWAKMIPMFAKTFDIGTVQATGLLFRVVRDTATDISAEKMNCAEERRIRWTSLQNLDLWFDSWETFIVEYGFATINTDGSLHFPGEMKARIINMDEACLSLDGSNSNRGGRPTVTYYDVRFPQLGKATSKSALLLMMICGSSELGKAIPPHFQFQTSATSAEGEAIRIEIIRYFTPVKGIFGWGTEQEFPISFGLNSKGGMDDDAFLNILKHLS